MLERNSNEHRRCLWSSHEEHHYLMPKEENARKKCQKSPEPHVTVGCLLILWNHFILKTHLQSENRQLEQQIISLQKLMSIFWHSECPVPFYQDVTFIYHMRKGECSPHSAIMKLYSRTSYSELFVPRIPGHSSRSRVKLWAQPRVVTVTWHVG